MKLNKVQMLAMSGLFFISLSTRAQNEETPQQEGTVQQEETVKKDLYPYRIGLKIGFPQIVGLSAEYVTPLLGNRIAPFVDFSYFSMKFSGVGVSLNYFEIGSNVYINKRGTGLYGALSYGSEKLEGTYSGAKSLSGQTFLGEATGSIKFNMFNLKIGAKLGRRLYFRIEAGRGFGSIPQKIKITGKINGNTETGEEDIPDIPGISKNGTFLFNLGFGYSF